MSLVYIEKIPAAIRNSFEQKTISIAANLQIDPNWLMQVMKSESGVKPQARNFQDGHLVAVGLIQFVKSTATGLGVTMDQLYAMTALQQLDYVYKYFKGYTGRMKSYYDVYAITFFPAIIGKPDDWVLQTSSLSAEIIAKQNPVININKDGKITVAEFKQYVQSTVPASLKDIIFKTAGGAAALLLFAFIFF